jgi:polyisoprenoid-binding protein YceI
MNATLQTIGTKWRLDSNQSDLVLKARHFIIGYIPGGLNKFKGSIDIHHDELEDASIEFKLDFIADHKQNISVDNDVILNASLNASIFPTIYFKSTSFQKISKNINFLKGNLTIQKSTKIIELDAALLGITTFNGQKKALFELTGLINRKEFGLNNTSYNKIVGSAIGQDIKLIANLEFNLQK